MWTHCRLHHCRFELLTLPMPSAHNIDALAQRVRTVVSVATPHQGTPHASLFSSILGQRLLEVFSLLPQLSIESMQVFNAAIATRATTRYGCVVIQTRPPSLSSIGSIGFSPSGQVMHALYRALYELGAGSSISADGLSGAQEGALTAAFGEMPAASANDGVVPTLSQLFGEVVHATWADHHDVIGHFHGPDHDPPHVDWLKTQTHFTHSAFTRLWGDIASFACDTS